MSNCSCCHSGCLFMVLVSSPSGPFRCFLDHRFQLSLLQLCLFCFPIGLIAFAQPLANLSSFTVSSFSGGYLDFVHSIFLVRFCLQFVVFPSRETLLYRDDVHFLGTICFKYLSPHCVSSSSIECPSSSNSQFSFSLSFHCIYFYSNSRHVFR